MKLNIYEFEGTTKDEAINNARNGIPKDLIILAERILRDEKRKYIDLEADSESNARSMVLQHMDTNYYIETVNLTIPARKGILGIGKRNNLYNVVTNQKVKISVTAAEVSETIRPLCESLLNTIRPYDIGSIIEKIVSTNDPSAVVPILCTINRFEDRDRDSDIDSLRIKCAKALRKLNVHVKFIFKPWCFLCHSTVRPMPKVEIFTNLVQFGQVQCPNCSENYNYSVKEFDEHLYLSLERSSVYKNDTRASRNEYGPIMAELI